MDGDIEFGGETDVFAEIDSDPLADEKFPEGVEAGELAGDNPSEMPEPEEELPEPDPQEVLQEPEESEVETAPEPETPAAPPEQPAPEPESEPAAEPKAETPAAEPAPEPESEAKPAKTKKRGGKKKAAAKKAPADRSPIREYVVLYEIEGGFAEGARIEARSVKRALRESFGALVEKTGQKEFSAVVAVPATHWNPQPIRGESRVENVVSIG